MTCNICHITNIYSVKITNHFVVCKQCFNHYFATCSKCGTIIEKRNASLGRCSKCRIIQTSNYKPTFKFYKTEESKPVYIGVELELENDCRDNLINFVEYNNDFFYYKKDYSLSDNGIEIVSHPATYNYHRNNNWKELFNLIKQYNFKSKNNCGLHFHIDKTSISYKMGVVLDYLVNTSPQLVYRIGGRKNNGFCALRPYKSAWGVNGDHYSAMNFSNKDTVEIRFCASTIHYNTFIKRMMHIQALIDYAQYRENAMELVSYNDFKHFMEG